MAGCGWGEGVTIANKPDIAFLPFASESRRLWAVHVFVSGKHGWIYTFAFRCFGKLEHKETFIIRSYDNAPWELRSIGSERSDCAGKWFVLHADTWTDAMKSDSVLKHQQLLRRKRSVRKSVRYAVLERDGFRCRYCGASSSDGVTLHVDHIVPHSKGGTDDESNLCASCDQCNLGKGNRFTTPPPKSEPAL
jgi:5-methylcytosine-specific restriction endonuclease McrA